MHLTTEETQKSKGCLSAVYFTFKRSARTIRIPAETIVHVKHYYRRQYTSSFLYIFM